MPDYKQLRSHVDARIYAMRLERDSWWSHWRELAQYILPRRYKWLVNPNESTRGSAMINSNIIDSTGTIAARTCASGMMSGITSPTRPWFKLGLEGMDLSDSSNEVALWLAEVEKVMMKIFAESNFYNSIAIMYLDLTVFGSAAMLIFEDFEDVIRCHNPCLGEYFFATDYRGRVNTVYREFVLTVNAIVEEFGEKNCPEDVCRAYAEPGGGNREFVICQAIEPNDSRTPGVAKKFKYRSAFWVKNTDTSMILEAKGFNEEPFLAVRWDVNGGESYGRSPGMDALGDIKQLQQEQKRKAQAIDKMVNPPMVADIQLKNQPASLLPGGVTYIAGQNNVGFKPIYQVMPPVQELMMDIEKIQQRIKEVFFNDLFMMISQLNTVRSATEIDARREEKLIQMGPVLERFENEALDPAIERVFGIGMRGNLFPPAPQSISGKQIEVTYVSMLAEAQKASGTSAIERMLAQAGNLAAVAPDIMDNIDVDLTIAEYGGLLAVAPKLIREKKEVEKIRAQRQKQQQQAQMLEQTMAGAKAAKTLSETDVGGGSNALSMMIGGGQGH